jgi:ribosome-associated translation inhibitor RaiA
MRIEVLGAETISAQARIYAEYRLFAALSQNVDTNRVKHARLTLQRTKPSRACDSVSCTVFVDFEGSNPLRIQAAADHPYAAINRAVERLSEGCWRRPRNADYLPLEQAAAEA